MTFNVTVTFTLTHWNDDGMDTVIYNGTDNNSFSDTTDIVWSQQ